MYAGDNVYVSLAGFNSERREGKSGGEKGEQQKIIEVHRQSNRQKLE